MNICDKAREKAVDILKECTHKMGLMASGGSKGYPQIWARDSMISLFGVCFTDDEEVMKALRSSFETLKEGRTKYGSIPNAVDVNSKRANFQAYADAGLWFVVGVSAFFKTSKDEKFLEKHFPVVEDILEWYAYQDVDQSKLITISEASDWEDLFPVMGKGLYVNVLYQLALKKAWGMALELGYSEEAQKYLKRARNVKLAINKHFWYEGSVEMRHVEFSFGVEKFEDDVDELGREMMLPNKEILKDESYYLPYLSFRNFGEWFDSFGNLLAIISGVTDEKKSEEILKFIDKYGMSNPFPVKAIYPVITPGDKDWRYYYKFGDLNLPHQYHNGGVWPFLGGFYILSLEEEGKHEEAKENLKSLAELNKKGREGPWEFNEWIHGETTEPMGMVKQAWSAGMYIYAYETVKREENKFF